jgi:hypothetical protein
VEYTGYIKTRCSQLFIEEMLRKNPAFITEYGAFFTLRLSLSLVQFYLRLSPTRNDSRQSLQEYLKEPMQ